MKKLASLMAAAALALGVIGFQGVAIAGDSNVAVVSCKMSAGDETNVVSSASISGVTPSPECDIDSECGDCLAALIDEEKCKLGQGGVNSRPIALMKVGADEGHAVWTLTQCK